MVIRSILLGSPEKLANNSVHALSYFASDQKPLGQAVATYGSSAEEASLTQCNFLLHNIVRLCQNVFHGDLI